MRSPKWKITRGKRGWQKWLHGKVVWVASFAVAETGAQADAEFERRAALPDDDRQKIRLDAPREVVARPDQITMEQLGKAFLTLKRRKFEAMRMTKPAYDQLTDAIMEFIEHVGPQTQYRDLGPRHFTDHAERLAKRFGVYCRAKCISNVRSMFKWAAPGPKGTSLVPALPNYGSEFKLPSRAEFRIERKLRKEKTGIKRYTAEEIREQIHGKRIEIRRKRMGNIHVQRKASKPLRAMILLALNGGFGNRDCAWMPLSVAREILDGAEFLEYARGKTGIERCFWVWPETRKAMQEWWTVRQAMVPGRHAVVAYGQKVPERELFFLTQQGQTWIDYHSGKDQIGMRYLALLDALGQRRRGFRSLRRTARTIAAETGQEMAIDLIMGHADESDDMAKTYTVEISKEIVQSICQHVRSRILLSTSQPLLFPALSSADA